MRNPTHSFRETNLCFSSCKNRKLKVKRKKKKEGIFCTVYFVWRKFFNICVLSECIVYWIHIQIHFQNIHTFTYQKTLLHTLFCWLVQSSKAFSVSLILISFNFASNKYDRRHNIFRHFVTLSNFLFTTSETKLDY